MSIINYFFIGALFTFVLDLILTKLNKHPLMKEIIEKWGWKERVACVIIWPIAFITFSFSFIKTYFK